MSKVECGMALRYGDNSPGSGGCLVRFNDAPQRALLLTAGHAVVAAKAAQGDRIDGPQGAIGALRTWTTLKGDTTVDAALVWVDPALVSAEIAGLGAPSTDVATPKVGDQLRLKPRTGSSAARVTHIMAMNREVVLSVVGPGWGGVVTYRNQILCSPSVSDPGDSGAVMLDDQGRVVGMLVGGSSTLGDVVTPMDAILNNVDWKGQLKVLASVPSDVLSPFAAPPPVAPTPLGLVGQPWPGSVKFADLKPRYESLFAGCVVPAAHKAEVEWHRKKLLTNKKRYEDVAQATQAPWWFIGIVHALEGSFKFTTHLHNGDPLTARTTHVPKNRPAAGTPPFAWKDSAIDAITVEGYANQPDWSLARCLHRFEGYNGYGYYARYINSPYLWSFSNHYSAGKFVADGVYDPAAVSKQCGAAVMLKALIASGDITPPPL